MGRRHRVQVSLFPFMSVLACTIGSLIVLLAIMSLSAVAASRDSEEAKERSDETRATRSLDLLRLEATRVPLEQAEAAWREVDRVLAARGLESGLSIPRIDHYLAERREETQATQTLGELKAKLREIDRHRESVETSIAVLESRRETLPILIDPTGLSKRWKPFFIECDEGGATAYRVTDDFREFVPREELAPSGNFGRYLRRLRATPGALLVLLVRPDGVATARQAEGIAEGAGLRVAQLPLPGTGDLDWSLLRRAEGAS